MDYTDYIRFAGALLIVLALMGGLSLLLRKVGMGGHAPLTLGSNKRIKVKETTALDYRRRLFLVEFDDKEHLILLGQNGETLIQSQDKTKAAGEDENETVQAA